MVSWVFDRGQVRSAADKKFVFLIDVEHDSVLGWCMTNALRGQVLFGELSVDLQRLVILFEVWVDSQVA